MFSISNRRFWFIPFGILFFSLLAGTPPVKAEKLKAYQAERYITQNGKEHRSGKLFVSDNRIRIENTIPNQPEEMVVIIRQDKKLMWTLYPGKKKYIESNMSDEDMRAPMSGAGHGGMNMTSKEENLGTETVNGFECKKKRIESSFEMMGQKMKTRSTVWQSDQIDFPMRTEDEHGSIQELRNIQSGTQRAELFEIPDGFTRAASMMEMMQEGKQGRPKADGLPKGQRQMPEEMRKMMEQQMKEQ
jgi:hypothetical protein